ncbi:unnamed protein product [Orchesella dallaii]|uniref:Uncharacterized protein n=1 Tax=Orchesella dallaii TaxID=48710 RepID=A0ABP1RUE1_9HEXA
MDQLYPQISYCFFGIPRTFEEKATERMRKINDNCGALHGNRTSLCFKICVLSKLHFIGKDSPILNEDITKNPDKFNELDYQHLMAVEYRAATGPVWTLVALRMLGIAYSDVKDEVYDKEKFLMKLRMEKCSTLKFQIPLSEKEGCITTKNTPCPEKWENLIECIENALLKFYEILAKDERNND